MKYIILILFLFSHLGFSNASLNQLNPSANQGDDNPIQYEFVVTTQDLKLNKSELTQAIKHYYDQTRYSLKFSHDYTKNQAQDLQKHVNWIQQSIDYHQKNKFFKYKLIVSYELNKNNFEDLQNNIKNRMRVNMTINISR